VTELTTQQRRAATLLAHGKEVREVAEEVGVSPKTVSRWKKLEAVRALVKSTRESLFPGDGVVTAESVLMEALTATSTTGRPLYGVRIAAARALLSSPVASKEAEAEARTTVIYMPEPEDDPEDDPDLEKEVEVS
jgi:hypothetical protein